jgi:hypothetical protein
MTTPAVQIAHIQSCDCLPELKSYWMALNELQPDMARDASVIDAKDARKNELLREREDAVFRISRAA